MTDHLDIAGLIARLRENGNPSTSKLSDCIDLCKEAADALAALSTSAAVPREPTEAMIRVAEELDLGEDQWDHATIWRAMYDAATSTAVEKEKHDADREK